MSADVVRFFQSFIAQMIEIGGINLARSISSKLGRNLGEIYKNRGVDDWEGALKLMFKGMGGETKSVELKDDHTLVEIEYPEVFCPIGGGNKPHRFDMFTEAICRPYATGFLSAFSASKRIKVRIAQCVLRDNDKHCCIDIEI